MSLNLTNLLQGIQNRLNFWTGPAASKQSGVVLLDTASVTWSHDEFGNITATAAGSGATGPANEVLATPNGSSGTAVLRTLVPADLPVGSSSQLGALKVDGTTITATAGVISASASGGFTLIQEQTVSSAVAAITFSSIPTTYTNLKMFINGGGVSGSAGVLLNFNGDLTGGNYFCNTSTQAFSSTITGAGSFSNAGAIVAQLNQYASGGGGGEVTLYGYNTGLQKFYTGMSVGNAFQLSSGIWNSVAAITSIVATLGTGGGNWAAGTVISLYGIQ